MDHTLPHILLHYKMIDLATARLEHTLPRIYFITKFLTFRQPGGAGSKIRVCISLGRALYTGRIISSGISGPSAFIRS